MQWMLLDSQNVFLFVLLQSEWHYYVSLHIIKTKMKILSHADKYRTPLVYVSQFRLFSSQFREKIRTARYDLSYKKKVVQLKISTYNCVEKVRIVRYKVAITFFLFCGENKNRIEQNVNVKMTELWDKNNCEGEKGWTVRYTVGTESIQTPLNFSCILTLSHITWVVWVHY